MRISEMTIGQFAAYIQTHLEKNNIECVLSGGACVTIYSENKYESFDLDFIENVTTDLKFLKNVMKEINFYEENRYFKHPESNYFVEFPPGPLSIGNESIKSYNTLVFETGELLLLTPTDCVRDRLAAFYYWDDQQALHQALMVSKAQQIDLNIIKKWSLKENQKQKFNTFLKSLNP